MKDVLSLTRAITEVEYYSDMFEKWGEDKNILFVSPQLSGRHLYKTILPFFCLSSQNVATAITSLKRYDYKKQLLDFQIDLNDEMVDLKECIKANEQRIANIDRDIRISNKLKAY